MGESAAWLADAGAYDSAHARRHLALANSRAKRKDAGATVKGGGGSAQGLLGHARPRRAGEDSEPEGADV